MAKMKHLLLTTIAAVVLVGCGPSVDIREAAEQGNIATVKQHLAAGADVNAKDDKGTYKGMTPLCVAAMSGDKGAGQGFLVNCTRGVGGGGALRRMIIIGLSSQLYRSC